MNESSVLSPPVTLKGGNYVFQKNEDDELPRLDNDSQKKIIIKSVTRGFILSLMIGGLYIYQKYTKKHYRGHNKNTFIFLFIALSSCNYLMHTFTPEFYSYVISGIGWGVGSVMFKYIIDI